MSFCNNSTDRSTTSSCEKVCIHTTKIFDACMIQTSIDTTVTLNDVAPTNPSLPLTFVGGTSTTTTGTISNLSIMPIADRAGLSRVRATITIPVSISYTDTNGVAGTGTSTVSIDQDVIMNVPSGSIITPTVDATVNMASPRGTYVDNQTFNVTSCITIILSVQAPVNLIVPTYGYCKIPPATEFSQDVCQGVFDMPIYPV